MSCAFSDSVSIDTRISNRRPPSPSAATGQVLNRTATSLLPIDCVAASCQYPSTSSTPSPRHDERQLIGIGSNRRGHPHFTRWSARAHRRLLGTRANRVARGGGMQTETVERRTSVWTAARLRRCLDECCGGNRLVVLANREPFRHDWERDRDPAVSRSASGLVTALEPLVSACRGVWGAHGAGSADRATATERDGLNVPPDRPAYRLRRVWLTEAEERRYYRGFANEGLWPLCHRAGVAPIFRDEDYAAYETVNDRFAAAVAEE